MASPKLTIAAICAAALAATVGVAIWEADRQDRNGRAGLRDRAVRFSEDLEDAAQMDRLAALVPWLETSERASPAAMAQLDTLALTVRPRLHLVLAHVRLAADGRRGQSEYLLTASDHSGSGGTISVDWVRAPDGTWFLDLIGS